MYYTVYLVKSDIMVSNLALAVDNAGREGQIFLRYDLRFNNFKWIKN